MKCRNCSWPLMWASSSTSAHGWTGSSRLRQDHNCRVIQLLNDLCQHDVGDLRHTEAVGGPRQRGIVQPGGNGFGGEDSCGVTPVTLLTS